MTKNCYCTYKNLGKITKSVEVDNTGLQGFVVGKREVISEVIFCVESESELRIGPSRQDFKIFEVMYSKNRVFFLLLRLCTGRTTFYWSSLQVASFSTTLTLQNQLSNDHQRFFFAKLRPFWVLTCIRTMLWAFALTLWSIPFCAQYFLLKICAPEFSWSLNMNS